MDHKNVWREMGVPAKLHFEGIDSPRIKVISRRPDSVHDNQKSSHINSSEEVRSLVTELRLLLSNLSAQQAELQRQNQELRELNEELETSRARAVNLLEMTGQLARVGGWELDLRSNELLWTKETCRIHELDGFESPALEEAIGFYLPEARTIIRAAIQQAISSGTPWDLELPMMTKKGRAIWVRAQGAALFENAKAIKLHGAFQDITERKQSELSKMKLETRLRESQKMEAIGTLAGGVAHDFNNILAAIMGNTDVALLSIDSPDVTTRCLREIGKASDRGRDLVRQILTFGQSRATKQKLISIAPVVEESIQLLRAMLPARITLTMNCAINLPKILVDETHIAQIVINLAKNAYQAIAEKPGCIQFEIDSLPLDAELRKLLPSLESSSNEVDQVVRLIVSDDGAGMSELTASRLFEPFFTTKPVGEGTGLGLAVVDHIVRMYQGAITLASKPGEGATFTIYFPASTKSSSSQDSSLEVSEPVDSHIANEPKPRVLFIEDDPAVLQSITCLLVHEGFSVAGFSDQAAAIQCVRDNPNAFDLIVTDYNMPHVSGIEFAKMVRNLRTDLPVVVITGLIDDLLQTEAARIGIQELITKPFSLKSFCSTLQRVAAKSALPSR